MCRDNEAIFIFEFFAEIASFGWRQIRKFVTLFIILGQTVIPESKLFMFFRKPIQLQGMGFLLES